MRKILRKVGIQRMHLSITQDINDSPLISPANITISLISKIRNKTRKPTLLLIFNMV